MLPGLSLQGLNYAFSSRNVHYGRIVMGWIISGTVSFRLFSRGLAAKMSEAEEEIKDFDTVAGEKARLPALLLLVAGFLNMMGGMFLLNVGIQYMRMTPEIFKDTVPKDQL